MGLHEIMASILQRTHSAVKLRICSYALQSGLLFVLAGCSPATNIMGFIAAPSAAEDAGALLSRSKIRLDQGDYAGALSDAEKALKLAPDCAACAIQVGYAHLGVAGLDLFQLARKMLEKDKTEEEASTTLTESGNASGQLSALASLVGLTAADYLAITLSGNRLGDLEGAPASGPFQKLPVYLPKTAPEARESDSQTLQHIAEAIAVICPFMPEAVKLLGDEGDGRHVDETCTKEGQSGTARSNGLFIWAIAHLVEAIAFHQLVLFATDGGAPNLQKRALVLEDRSVITSLTDYIKAVRDLAAVVDIILPTEKSAARASMLTAMFNDLQTVSLAFQNMPAVPAEISEGIVKAIVDLQGQKSQISSPKNDQDQSSVAFKDQLTEGLATELKKQITSKFESGQVSDQERVDLCSAYRQISTQAFASCDTP